MTEPPTAYEIGEVLGGVVYDLIELMARIDGVTTQEATDQLVSEYIAQRIIDEASATPKQ